MVADQAKSMDYRQRGPKTTWETLGGLFAEAFGWILALLGYILFWMLLREMQASEPAQSETEPNPWNAVLALAGAAVVLIIGGMMLRNGKRKTREEWIRKHSPEEDQDTPNRLATDDVESRKPHEVVGEPEIRVQPKLRKRRWLLCRDAKPPRSQRASGSQEADAAQVNGLITEHRE
ncbi:hypothetical protein IFT72_09895 [Frigoribacterium sp. CFBP 8754]|uniref:hypothetical protein n=1 Tax=Frigoribacterium sp. CFBP 8754 TaxID=2775290 RepID=UPI00178001AD|nr:hypothetical protein [Frigoribacterium sp. CFBP 8754]MBD8660498.1 hypothetical protein [Frigoribacterium sp. CFBP 8754]